MEYSLTFQTVWRKILPLSHPEFHFNSVVEFMVAVNCKKKYISNLLYKYIIILKLLKIPLIYQGAQICVELGSGY